MAERENLSVFHVGLDSLVCFLTELLDKEGYIARNGLFLVEMKGTFVVNLKNNFILTEYGQDLIELIVLERKML